MSIRLLIEEGIAETRAARLEAGRMTGLWYGPGAGEAPGMQPGDLYSGRISRIEPRLGGAFADIGEGPEGFWPLRREQPVEGALHLFEIRRLAEGGKGPVLRPVAGDVAQPGPVRICETPALAALKALGEEGAAVTVSTPVARQVLARTGITAEMMAAPDLFAATGIDEAEETALAPVLSLPDGARLIFAETDALTAIDIDLGRAGGQSRDGAVLKACLALLPVLTGQLALRQIGGQVVADFPALPRKEQATLEAAIAREAARRPGWRAEPLGKSGLQALTLPRRGPSLMAQLTRSAPAEPLPGRRFTPRHLAGRLFRALASALEADRRAFFEARCAPDVAALVDRQGDWPQKLAETYGQRFQILPGEDGLLHDIRERH